MFFSIVKISFKRGLNKMGAARWAALICQHGLCGLWTTSTAPAVCWHEPAVGRSTHQGCFPSSPAESLFQKNEEAFNKPTNKTTARKKEKALWWPWQPCSGTHTRKQPGPTWILEDKQSNNTGYTTPVTTFSLNTAVLCCPHELFCFAVSGELCSLWKMTHMFNLSNTWAQEKEALH